MNMVPTGISQIIEALCKLLLGLGLALLILRSAIQPEDLRDGRRRVLGVRVAHGLDRNRRAAAHGHLPHMDLLAHFVTFI